MTVPPDPAAPGGAEVFTVTLNGQVVELAAGSTVADIVHTLWPSGRGVAVALEREVVPRSRWASVTPGPGALIEVVSAAAGG